MATNTIWETKIAGFDLTLKIQPKPRGFTVTYGKQVKDHLDYTEAAARIGECIMHGLGCEGKLDNWSGG